MSEGKGVGKNKNRGQEINLGGRWEG